MSTIGENKVGEFTPKSTISHINRNVILRKNHEMTFPQKLPDSTVFFLAMLSLRYRVLIVIFADLQNASLYLIVFIVLLQNIVN